MKVKESKTVLFFILLICILFLGGCAKYKGENTLIEDIKDGFFLEIQMEEKFQELKENGVKAIKENPEYKDSSEVMVLAYKILSPEDQNIDCSFISLGIQFMLIDEVEDELAESLLAVPANTKEEFYQMLFWYLDNADDADEFLQIAGKDQLFSQSIKKADFKMFERFLKKNGFILCSAEITFEILREFVVFL